MKILLIALAILFHFNCSFSHKELAITHKNHSFKEINSCSGRGAVSSLGNFRGKLSFNFITQNDSSFCQFQDIIGRKVLLLWLTPTSVEAWNLIENKKYDNYQLNEILPILSVISPFQLTKFLWGKEIKLEGLNYANQENISITLESDGLNNLGINKAKFLDSLKQYELSVEIKSRVFSKEYLNLKRYWELILS